MKRLSAVILQKRNEVETFLLDSIELVKEEIGRRKLEEERSTSRSRGRLPALGTSKPSNLPASPEEHVDIRDLTWDDRERVLRLLFAKINNAAPFQPLPPHPLNDDAASMRHVMGADDERSPSADVLDQPLPHDSSFFVTQAEQA